LKPAHVFYSYSYLFRDAFGVIATDSGGMSLDLDSYYYDDSRKWCLGAEQITGSGDTLSDRTLFRDPDVSFHSIRDGALLKITAGSNEGRYRVVGKFALLSGVDTTAHAYTTSTGASGDLTALDIDTVEDTSQDWGAFPVDTTITIALGPNAGTYRLDTVLGSTGGPIGTVGVSGTQVRVSFSTLKVDRRMPVAATTQTYEVIVDRLGVQLPHVVTGEDMSSQFLL
jgi:hypothetical protein